MKGTHMAAGSCQGGEHDQNVAAGTSACEQSEPEPDFPVRTEGEDGRNEDKCVEFFPFAVVH